MKSIKDTLIIGLKDLRLVLADRGVMIPVFLLPLIVGTMLGYGYTSMANTDRAGEAGFSIKVYLVNEDTGAYSEQVLSILNSMTVLNIEKLPAAGGKDQANQDVRDGKKIAAILIPAGFSENIIQYEPTEVVVLTSPSQKALASVVTGLLKFAISPVVLQGEISYGIHSLLEKSGAFDNATPEQLTGIQAQTLGVIMTQLQDMLERPLISIETVSKAKNPDQPIDFFAMFMPGFSVMFCFFLMGGTAESLFMEKDTGTFRRLQAAPLHAWSIISGKALAYATLVVLQVLFLFGISASVFKMDLGRSPLGLVILTVAISLVVTMAGLLLAAISKTGKQADNISVVLSFVLAGIGGCFPMGMTPLYLQEHFLAKISRFTPHGQALWGFYKLMNDGGGVVDILPNVGFLLGMALIFGLIAVWRLRWD